MTKFGAAQALIEGGIVNYFNEKYDPYAGPWRWPTRANPPTVYVERRVPSHLEDECHWLIDAWLRFKGYDAEEI